MTVANNRGIIGAGVLLALLFWAGRSRAAGVSAPEAWEYGPPYDPGAGEFIPIDPFPTEGDLWGPGISFDFDDIPALDFGEAAPLPGAWMGEMNPDQTSPDLLTVAFKPSILAMLTAIRFAEHKDDDVKNGRDYFTFYGGARFEGTADHPAITGERQPVRLPERFCRAAGFKGTCYSTAAGAYQINVPTWREFRRAGAWGPRLNDFSPASQDEAARRILQATGAIARLDAGDLSGAIRLASGRWASLPGSTAGQPLERSETFARNFYAALEQYGGSAGVWA